MKFDQLTEYNNIFHFNRETFFFKHYAENEARILVPDHFLFLKNALYEVKANDLQLSFNILWQPSTWHTIKANCIKL